MRVAITDSTKFTHHGQVGLSLQGTSARATQFRPRPDAALADLAGFDALISFGGGQTAIADQSHPSSPDLARRVRAFSDDAEAMLALC